MDNVDDKRVSYGKGFEQKCGGDKCVCAHMKQQWI